MRGVLVAMVMVAGLGACGREEGEAAGNHGKGAAESAPSATSASQVADTMPETGRVAPRVFDSGLPLQIWVRGAWTPNWDKHDTTPASGPIQIPACDAWAVEPLEKWDRNWTALLRLIEQDHIPGLWMPATTKDEDLLELKKCRRLRFLGLANTGVTDAGLSVLKDIKGLQELDLRGTYLTNAGMERLKDIPGLRWLDLSRCPRLTDAGLTQVKEVKKLQVLRLAGVAVTDDGLPCLVDLQELQELDLANTRLTDQGLVQLRSIKSLQRLNLNGCTAVTDDSLLHLQELKGLQVLFLPPFLTARAKADLRRALPNCRIE